MEDGTYQTKCIRDEAALTLVRLNEEGGFERICDVASREERDGKMSHLHCAVFFGKKTGSWYVTKDRTTYMCTE